VAARTKLWSALAFCCAAIVAAGCSGSGSPTAPSAEPSTSTTLAGMQCSFSAHSCTPEQVRTTLTTLYERSGTTPIEAKCLAALTTPAHSMMEEFRAGDASKDAAAARCVGSTARLVAVGEKLAVTLRQIDARFAAALGEDCKSTSSVTAVPMPGTAGPPPSDWYKMTPEQLRNAGWRQVEETSPSTCEPAP
jgi:hypothetical protein